MTVSIIICTHNRADELHHTLNAMSVVHVPSAIDCELLVVDNASTDDTPQVVRSCHLSKLPIRYVREPQRGKSHAYNTGMAAAEGDILLFTDDDVRPPPNWIEGMCAPILSRQSDAVAGGVKLASHLERPWMGLDHRCWLASSEQIDSNNPQSLIGANMAFSRRVLTKVPAFDPELGPSALGTHEEGLFAWQLKHAGYIIGSALQIEVEHHFDQSRLQRSGFISTSRNQGRSSAYVAHHWEHREVDAPRTHMLRELYRLFYWRTRKQQECRMPEGVPWWELYMVRDFHFYRQYLIERKRPRNYERYGLVKLVH